MDPFKVLGVNYTDDLPHIKSIFRQLVLKYHPDRGGNPNTFNKIREAYDTIYKFKIDNINQIKRENISFNEYLQNRKSINNNKRPRKQVLNPNNIDMDVFNKIYENTRLEDVYDIGRESFLKNDQSKKRTMSIIREPTLLCNSVLQNVKEIGIDKIKDLSVYNSEDKTKLQCSDIKYAFEDKESLKDIQNPVNTRKSSELNSEEICRYRNNRNNINYKMSNKDKEYYKIKKQKELELENKRLFNYNRQIEIGKRQWERLSNYVSL